jgi:hypothetical protein
MAVASPSGCGAATALAFVLPPPPSRSTQSTRTRARNSGFHGLVGTYNIIRILKPGVTPHWPFFSIHKNAHAQPFSVIAGPF